MGNPAFSYTRDQVVSDSELGRAYGLDQQKFKYDQRTDRKSFPQFMRKLTDLLSKDTTFEGVEFTQDYPDEIAHCPRVVWGITHRIAGIENRNRKNPFKSASFPLESGEILEKWIQPHTVEVSFEIFDTTSQGANLLSESLEEWILMSNEPILHCGALMFIFSSEGPHEVVSVSESQKIHKRTLFFQLIIDYIYTRIVQSIKSIKVWSISKYAPLNTIAITRSSGLYDLCPVTGPAVLVALHDKPNAVQVDYLYQVDYDLIVNKEKFDTSFFIRWLPRGRAATAGNQYYATFYTPIVESETSKITITMDETDPTYAKEMSVPQTNNLNKKRRGIFPDRYSNTARVLGQEVDMANPTRGQTILYINERNEEVAALPLTINYLESILRAETEVVTVLDPSAVPMLPSGTALSPL